VHQLAGGALAEDGPLLFFVILCAVAVGLLIAFERAGSWRGIALCKPVASSAFVGAALAGGAPTSHTGYLILAALVLSWLGDVLLIPRGHPRMFLAGMVSFLAAHLAYCLAFWYRGPDLRAVLIATPVIGAIGLLVSRWLLPHASGAFRTALPVYLAAISAMVILATSIVGSPVWPYAAVGAGLFATSDLMVARDRFIRASWRNRAVGLPLYYAAQLLLAATAAR
jgi:uncharacterized membrane protein YhhN